MTSYRYKPTGEIVRAVRTVKFDGKNPCEWVYTENSNIRQPIVMYLLEPVKVKPCDTSYQLKRSWEFLEKRFLAGLRGQKHGYMKMYYRAMETIGHTYADDSEWCAAPYEPTLVKRKPSPKVLAITAPLPAYNDTVKGRTADEIIAAADDELRARSKARLENKARQKLTLEEAANVIYTVND